MGKDEQLRLEHSTLIEQYKSTRAEITSLLDASRQTLNLSLTAISIFLSVSIFAESRLPIAFLILPFFLYGLALVQLRHILLIRRASAYISEVIAPRLRELLQEASPADPIRVEHILNWEETWQSPMPRQLGLLSLPILGSNYGLPLLAALLSLAAYLFSVPEISMLGWILIAINFVALLYTVVIGFLVEFKRFGQEFESWRK
ncbi:MAG: hypothetical protein KC547_17610 [Anaerolineae bacterium]|nr:hypothetical protein [Anaerolineae bacterium]MCA9908940.1 hypothetical protein [Anaerolineae bacterium]